VSLRDAGFYLRARLTARLTRWGNRDGPALAPPAPLDDVLSGARTPLALSRLLEGRNNADREAALIAWLQARNVSFARHPFETFEGRGENLSVDVGRGDRIVVLAAHHDAVPGSPGANDNAASVAVLLTLLERWMAREPTGVRVRLLFPACEELGYLGARVWVRDHGVGSIAGVLSLELPGVGDSLAVWDAAVETPFLGSVRRAFEEIDLRLDEGYHVVGRIPVFGSDHRAFADVGVPAYGLTTVPAHEVPALRQFIWRPLRSMFRGGGRRPPPFDTYHTARDSGATLDATALDRMVSALTAVVETLR
jgi:Zn-dependent M28 family amino/carboxypeptidase